MAFLDIKISIEGNGLCSSVYYKPIDSNSYLLYSSSHPSHVKNSIPFSQFLRIRRLRIDDSDFFDNRGYPASVVQAGHHCAQQIDRQSALQTAEKKNTNRIPFTLTFHPHNHVVRGIILKNLKSLQNDSGTGTIFSQPPLISFIISKLALLIPSVSTSAYQSTNLFMFSCHLIPSYSVAPFFAYKPTHNLQFLQSL